MLESRFRFRPEPEAGYFIEGVIDRVDETPTSWPTTPAFQIAPDPDYSAALPDRYATTARRVEAGSFTATPGPHCAWCDFRDRCPFRATDA